MITTRRKRAFIAFAVFDLLLITVIAGTFFLRNSTDTDLGHLGVAVFPDQQSIDSFQLTDHEGNIFTETDLGGTWNLLFFGFTSCPDVCPLTMNALKLFYLDLQETEYSDDTRVVMVSVDPQRDSVDAMARYVDSFHEEFVGLTGDIDIIENLASQLYIAFMEPTPHVEGHGNEDYIIQHSGYIAIISPDGKYHSLIRSPHSKESLSNAYNSIRSI